MHITQHQNWDEDHEDNKFDNPVNLSDG